MNKIKLIAILILCPFTKVSFGQWTTGKFDNGFEIQYKYAICMGKEESGRDRNFALYMHKDKGDSVISFQLWDLKKENEFCDKYFKVDLSFEMDTGRFIVSNHRAKRADEPKYIYIREDYYNKTNAADSLKSKVILCENLSSWENKTLFQAVSKSKVLRVRIKVLKIVYPTHDHINNPDCPDRIFIFNMTGSSAALRWLNSK